jgi:hypothetical protein
MSPIFRPAARDVFPEDRQDWHSRRLSGLQLFVSTPTSLLKGGKIAKITHS